MARSFGKVLSSAWLDSGWTSLNRAEQWLYMALISQPGMSLVGCLEWRPRRLQVLADDLTPEEAEASVAILEAGNFVVIDRDTEELLVRTFTRHDGIASANKNLRKGMWSAWGKIASPELRRVAVLNMPGELFLDQDVPAPDAAVRLRWSEDQERASERAFGPSFDQASESLGTRNVEPSPSGGADHRLPEETIALGFAGVSTVRASLERRGSTEGTSTHG